MQTNTNLKGKVVVFGAAGRVGQSLVSELINKGVSVCLVDTVNDKAMHSISNRLFIDAQLRGSTPAPKISVYGNVDVTEQAQVESILQKEKPSVVVNYAIPFTWDATKRLKNYAQISAAGLGAFAPIQVLAPKIIAQAISAVELDCDFIVGNLPDITIPILHGLSTQSGAAKPSCGAGNVGLMQNGIRHIVARELNIKSNDIKVSLVAHHVHWVAPREPGYSNEAPFFLKIERLLNNDIKDLSKEFGSQRDLLNRAITECYEPGAGFSSTTGLLASQVVCALLNKNNESHHLHVPAPLGMDGGYPVIIKNGKFTLNLPEEWQANAVQKSMQEVHKLDGIEQISKDGCIHFQAQTLAILKQELGMTLPSVVYPDQLEQVARAQIQSALAAIS